MTDAQWVEALLAPQPDPVGDGPSVTDAAMATGDDRIRALLEARRAQGMERYNGVELRAENGRDVRADIVQEAVDLLLYAEQLRIEYGDTWLASHIQSALSLYLTRIGWTP